MTLQTQITITKLAQTFPITFESKYLSINKNSVTDLFTSDITKPETDEFLQRVGAVGFSNNNQMQGI